jgi:hypothetical protein
MVTCSDTVFTQCEDSRGSEHVVKVYGWNVSEAPSILNFDFSRKT